MKNKLIIGLSVVIMVLLLLLNRGCDNTIVKQGKTDTLTTKEYIHDTTILVKNHIVYKPIPFSVYVSPNDSITDLDSIRLYRNDFKDSLVSISVTDSVRGKLLLMSLKYKILIPKDSVIITNNITRVDTISNKEKFSIYTGLQLGLNKSNITNLSPYIMLNIKNKQVGYGYNLLNNSHNIIVGIKIFKK